jgi:lipoprotein NlpD
MMSGCAANNYAPESYVVQPQDTLYSIAWRHNLDYRDLARWNNIGSDYRLAVGQVLTLRPSGNAAAPRTPPRTPARVRPALPTSSSSAVSASQPSGASRPQGAVPRVGKPTPLADVPTGGGADEGSGRAESAPIAPGGGNAKWVWPTNRSSPPRPVPGGGILLFGRLGQDVRTASTGRVVYTGSGIRGYGNLIIIKHGDSLLSSYAHNREILVHEGQDVLAGQVIAHMGTGPHQVSALYFEIRVNGKPTDPLRYLPGAK